MTPGLKSIITLLNFIGTVAFADPTTLSVTGKVIQSQSDRNIFIVRSLNEAVRAPDKDFLIDTRKLSAQDLARLKENMNSAMNDDNIVIPKSAVIAERPAMDLHSDCSEKPISYESITQLAKKPVIKDQTDFLKSLPLGTLETFTFNYDSQSIQKTSGGTDKAIFPRVIRMSEDGKLVITYTCDPKSESYNKVEVMRFDDATSTFKFSELNFRKPTGLKSIFHSQHRVNENSKRCATCHSSFSNNTNLRPIWPEYPDWKRFYGSDDDSFLHARTEQVPEGMTVPKGIVDRNAKVTQEKDDYLRFRETQKDNPCYSTLPWPKDPEDRLYPYSSESKSMDYHVRPNLKFTEVFGRLEAKKIANQLKSNPKYEEIKYLLAAEGLGGCGLDVEAEIKRHIPHYDRMRSKDGRIINPSLGTGSEGDSSNLYSSALVLGVATDQWNLNFTDKNTPYYNASVPAADAKPHRANNDVGIPQVIVGEITKDISAHDPILGSYFQMSHGTESEFGEKFSCIDKVAGEMPLKNKLKESEVCSILINRQKAIDSSLALSCATSKSTEGSLTSIASALEKSLKPKKPHLSPELIAKIANGKHLTEETCKKCHTASAGVVPKELQFFSTEKTLRKALEDPYFKKEFELRLHAKDSSKMPMGTDFTDDQINDVEKYLDSQQPSNLH